MRLLGPALTLVLLVSLLPAAALSAQEVVARLVRHQPQVEATPPGAPISPGADIRKGVEVRTGKEAGALIAVGFRPPVRGMMKMGPESRVRFAEWVVSATTGGKVGFHVQLGSFLASFEPPSKNNPQIEPRVDKWIDTPTARIWLYGTMVSVQVAPNGTTSVLVIEGNATVEAKGGTVKLTAGTRTTVRLGQPPTPPAPANPTSTLGTLDLRPSVPSFRDSPLLGVHDLNLDLPKVARP